MTNTLDVFGFENPDAIDEPVYSALYSLLEGVAQDADADDRSPSEALIEALAEVTRWAAHFNVTLDEGYIAPGDLCPDCGSCPGVDETDHESDCPRGIALDN